MAKKKEYNIYDSFKRWAKNESMTKISNEAREQNEGYLTRLKDSEKNYFDKSVEKPDFDEIPTKEFGVKYRDESDIKKVEDIYNSNYEAMTKGKTEADIFNLQTALEKNTFSLATLKDNYGKGVTNLDEKNRSELDKNYLNLQRRGLQNSSVMDGNQIKINEYFNQQKDNLSKIFEENVGNLDEKIFMTKSKLNGFMKTYDVKNALHEEKILNQLNQSRAKEIAKMEKYNKTVRAAENKFNKSVNKVDDKSESAYKKQVESNRNFAAESDRITGKTVDDNLNNQRILWFNDALQFYNSLEENDAINLVSENKQDLIAYLGTDKFNTLFEKMIKRRDKK